MITSEADNWLTYPQRTFKDSGFLNDVTKCNKKIITKRRGTGEIIISNTILLSIKCHKKQEYFWSVFAFLVK